MIGVDEVGRGCWAGPLLVVAARAHSTLPQDLNDSKVLTKKQRQRLHEHIRSSCELGEGWVEACEIDELGLGEAMKLGVQRALTSLRAQPSEEIIMDGPTNYCAPEFTKVRCVVKADRLYPIVSAASIYAKVTRDKKMIELATIYPYYGFEKHLGYGTKQHLLALQKLGVCNIHRKSYKPVYTVANS